MHYGVWYYIQFGDQLSVCETLLFTKHENVKYINVVLECKRNGEFGQSILFLRFKVKNQNRFQEPKRNIL